MTSSLPDIAWIVGVGPSAGLGAALARRFAKGGRKVLLTGRNEIRLQSIASEIAAASGSALALPGDISLPTDAARLAVAVRNAGNLRSAIFNAGNMVRGNALEVTPDQFESTWRGSAYDSVIPSNPAWKKSIFQCCLIFSHPACVPMHGKWLSKRGFKQWCRASSPRDIHCSNR